MKAYSQETRYSCGASAIRNCISALGGQVPSEKYVRRIAGTTINGTNETGIVKALSKLGYQCESYYTENTLNYKNKLSKVLQAGSVAITIIDNQIHWIAVVGYSNRKITFVDSDFKKIKQEISLKDFVKISGNTDKFNKSYFYYLIIISNNV